jgi:RimJ/RimL family protein N-acetyltransferase
MSPDFMEALLAGRRDEAAALIKATIPREWPGEPDEVFLRRRLEQMRRDPASGRWLVRALVLRDGPATVMVGHAGFHGPPGVNGLEDPAALEIGYTVFPEHRGRGYATEAAAGLIEWARAGGVRRFIASVAPGNAPSLAIVRKLGFVQTGDQWDEEDGLELVFELRAEDPAERRS